MNMKKALVLYKTINNTFDIIDLTLVVINNNKVYYNKKYLGEFVAIVSS